MKHQKQVDLKEIGIFFNRVVKWYAWMLSGWLGTLVALLLAALYWSPK